MPLLFNPTRDPRLFGNPNVMTAQGAPATSPGMTPSQRADAAAAIAGANAKMQARLSNSALGHYFAPMIAKAMASIDRRAGLVLKAPVTTDRTRGKAMAEAQAAAARVRAGGSY